MTDQWRQRPELGHPALMAWFARLCLRVGPRVARLMLRPVCAYFFLFKSHERAASNAFLRRVLAREPTAGEVWRHFLTFAETLLDRIYILGADGRGIELEPVNPTVLHEALDQGRGCILLGSHLGSFEASRAIKRARPEVQLRLVMDRQRSPAATAFLESLNPELAHQVLEIGPQPGAGLALLTALRDGALVAMLADRARAGEKTVSVNFLGQPAHFPTAPHEVAMVTQAPIVLFWGLHRGRGKYRIEFEAFPAPPRVAREERTQAVSSSVQHYARRLEEKAREAPYNWFNFYDFWGDPR